jgi:hypothetical protein
MNSVALYPTLFFVAMSRLSNILNVVLTAQPSLLDAQVKMQALHFCNKTGSNPTGRNGDRLCWVFLSARHQLRINSM